MDLAKAMNNHKKKQINDKETDELMNDKKMTNSFLTKRSKLIHLQT